MKKETKNLITILTVIAAIFVIYFISVKFFPDEPVKPSYESYGQDNRLERIRKGMTGK
jgi:hypothetical protein